MTPKLINYLASSNPCLFLPTIEDNKALTHIIDSLIELGFVNRELGVWKSTTGMLTFQRGKWVNGLQEVTSGRPIMGFVDALNKVAQTEECIGVFYHIRSLFEQPNTIQAIIDAAYQAKQNFSTIIFIGAFLPLPPELLNIVTYVDFPLPTKAEIESLFEELIQAWEEKHKLDFPKNKKKRKELISKAAMSAQGLDMLSAENALALAISITAEPNTKIIQSQKEQHVKKSEVLEFIDTDLGLKDVGGFGALKEWLLRRKEAFTDRAKEYGLPWPKGILIVGAPGLGKSFISACIASFLELPILRLNISNVFDRYLGSSENNLKRALQIVEAVSPCLTGDSKILLEGGKEVEIKDLYDNGNVEDLSVVCMDENLHLTTTKVDSITCREAPDLYELQLRHGKLKATGDHRQPVMRDGELQWIKTKDLLISDYVAMPKKIESFCDTSIFRFIPTNARLYLDLPASIYVELGIPCGVYRGRRSTYIKLHECNNKRQDDLYEHVLKVAIGSGGTTDSTLLKIPREVNEDMGYLLGLISSDGCINKRTISFGNTCPELHQIYHDLMLKLFGISTVKADATSRATTILGSPIKSELKPYWVSRSGNLLLITIFKEVYANLLTLPVRVLRAFMRGYFDGDGCVTDSNQNPKISIIGYTSKVGGYGNNLNTILRSVLLRLGFPSTHTKRLTHIEICGWHNVTSFINEIGSSHPIKRAKMDKILEMDPGEVKSRVDVIPVGKLVEKARKSVGAGQHWFTPEIVNSNIHYYETSVIHPDRKKLEILVNKLDTIAKKPKGENTKEVEQLRSLIYNDIMWSRVKKINKLPHDGINVYDLVCRDHHNFIANNIITHNCLLILEEIDKSMAGMESSGKTDSGVTARVLSTLLTWRQETTYPVFMVCTANNPDMMPPMIYRKGRLDEVWAVDLPNTSEREEIFRIHLERRKRDASLFDTVLLSTKSKNFTGAEIEAAIEDAMFNAFYEGVEIDTGHILKSIDTTLPQSDSSSEEHLRLKEWMDSKARSVSYQEETQPTKALPFLRILKT